MAKADWQNKFFKLSLMLNAIIMNIFFTLNFFTNFRNRNPELTVVYYVIFALLTVLANYILYLYYKRKTNQKTLLNQSVSIS
jgi:hypothetical protein